jgi:biopolymer transport protein ExbB
MAVLSSIRFFLDSGGFTAWIIVGSGVVLIITALERAKFLYVTYSYKADEALQAVRKSVLSRKYTDAIQICNSKPQAPDLQVVKAGLLAVEHGREAMKSSLGGAVLSVTRACEKRISLIALIAGIATLLGLLGTITGLIKTFSAIAQTDAAEKAKLLGVGISEAMYSTASGLGLGIVAMCVHTLFTSKSDDIVGNSQDTGYKLITWVEESERSQ